LTERWVFLYGCASQPPADEFFAHL
jgi:hypothetical protein